MIGGGQSTRNPREPYTTSMIRGPDRVCQILSLNSTGNFSNTVNSSSGPDVGVTLVSELESSWRVSIKRDGCFISVSSSTCDIVASAKARSIIESWSIARLAWSRSRSSNPRSGRAFFLFDAIWRRSQPRHRRSRKLLEALGWGGRLTRQVKLSGWQSGLL